MKAFKDNNITFNHVVEIDFQKNKKLSIIINILSLFIFVVFYYLFDLIARAAGINPTSDLFYYFKSLSRLPVTANFIFLGGLLIILSLHELILGLFFYIYTGEKPVIGFKSVYAYAGAPEWYIKKKYFQVITLSPVVLMTITGFVLMLVLPPGYASVIFLLVSANAAGSIGDIWVSIVLSTKPEETYIIDSGLSSKICHN